MDELEFNLENLGGTRFEELAMAYLRIEGYNVHESGQKGTDAGWDARISLDGLQGIGHASVREDWRQKLRKDAEKVRDLEKETGENYNLLVFVTNQPVSGRQELDMEGEIRDEYGWSLKIYHRSNLLGEIRTNHPELAQEYLDIDLGTGRDHLDDLIDLRDGRLEMIENRTGDAANLDEGPVIALHLIPTGIFSSGGYSGKVPTPPVFWEPAIPHGDVRGKSTFATSSGRFRGDHDAFGMLRNDGLYESAFTLSFYGDNKDATLPLNVSGASPGFDAFVVMTVQRAVEQMNKMGLDGSVLFSIAFLEAAELSGNRQIPGRITISPETAPLGVDRYVTDPTFVNIHGDNLIEELEPAISEVWRQLGIPDGTDNIEDGEWVGGNVDIGEFEL